MKKNIEYEQAKCKRKTQNQALSQLFTKCGAESASG